LTGKSYKYYADMDLHDELKVKELAMNENTLKAGVKVLYKNVIYITGNRYHDLTELYRLDHTFYKTVKMSEIKIVKK